MLVALTVLLVGGGAPLAQPAIAADPLFTPARQPADPAVVAARELTEIRARLVDVNFSLLPRPKDVLPERGAPTADVQSLTLNLFDDLSLLVDVAQKELTSNGQGLILIGTVRGAGPDSSATIVVEGDVMTANIRPDRSRLIQVRPSGNGVHTIRDVDQAAFPEPVDDVLVRVPRGSPSATTDASTADDTDNVVDVLVIYTNAARAQVGGPAAIHGLIDLAESESNQGYANSGVLQRIRIVGKEEIAYTEQAGGGIAGFDVDLDRLLLTNDGIMDDVHTLRDTYGADFVTLVRTTDPANQLCGLAAMIFGGTTPLSIEDGAPLAFNVSAQNCITGNYTFAHELAHTMGVRHNVQADNSSSPYSYAHGYCAPTGTPGYRDIMSVASTCTPTNLPRHNYWSNPGVTHNGVPTGDITADSQQALDVTVPLTQNFRPKVGPANNFFNTEAVLAGALPLVHVQSTTGANAEPNEGSILSCATLESSVWMRWISTVNGPVTVSTVGSSFDTQVGVLTGSSRASLTPVACNDDSAPSTGLTHSRVTFNATAGTTYHFVADGLNGATGTLNLRLSLPAPTVAMTGTPLAYAENQGTSAIDPGLTVADVDSTTLTGATVSITSGFQSAQDSLGFANQNGITGSYQAGTGVLTLTGTTSLANYQTALRSVTYANTSDAPTTTTRTVSFQVADDGATPSDVVTRQIAVSAVNDAPVNTVPGAQTTPANTPRTFSTGNGNLIAVADPDAGGANVQTTLAVNSGTLSLGGTGGLSVTGNGTATVTASGPLASLNAGLQGLTFTPATAFGGNALLTVTTTDLGSTGGAAQQDQDTVQIAVATLPSLAVDDPTAVAEGESGSAGTISFTVTLSAASNLTVTVPYSTTSLSATGGATCGTGIDYQTTSGTLTFAPGATSKTVNTPICGDFALEESELFRLDLGTPTNAVVGKSQGTATILNDDGACTARVQTRLATGGGALVARVESHAVNGQTNRIQQIRFGSFQNARVTLDGQNVVSGQTVAVTGGPTSVELTVQRQTPGQATTVPFVVVDGCGESSLFVGGGPAAGF